MDFKVSLKRLGKNIRRARWRVGLTQQQLAAKGLNYRYLGDLERGVRNPSLRMLHDIAEMLDVRVLDLLDVGERKAPVDLSKVSEDLAPKSGRPRTKKRATK
ncbi:MAG: helix-turn-helix domain-containing protein [Polyangiales bacterium]